MGTANAKIPSTLTSLDLPALNASMAIGARSATFLALVMVTVLAIASQALAAAMRVLLWATGLHPLVQFVTTAMLEKAASEQKSCFL